MFFLVCMTLQL